MQKKILLLGALNMDHHIIDKNVCIGNNVDLVNKDKLMNFTGDKNSIRDEIIVIPHGTHILDGLFCNIMRAVISIIVFLFVLINGDLNAIVQETPYPGLSENPYLEKSDQDKIQPFLLPLTHPMKEQLDLIFHKSRAIQDRDTFEEAGFEVLMDDLNSLMILAKHPGIPGYLFKVYFDGSETKKNKSGWGFLLKRCKGASDIRSLIHEKELKYFSVPDKWLYLLPIPFVESDKRIEPVILMVTDMELVTPKENVQAWKTKITKEHLQELYLILSHGHGSSGLVKNVPYTNSGKFAFIDTEHPNKTPKYDKARQFLSKEVQAYWDQLVRTEGAVR